MASSAKTVGRGMVDLISFVNTVTVCFSFRFACSEYLLMNSMDLKKFMRMKNIKSDVAGIEAWTERKLIEYYTGKK